MERDTKKTKTFEEIQSDILYWIIKQGGTGKNLIISIMSKLSVPEMYYVAGRGGYKINEKEFFMIRDCFEQKNLWYLLAQKELGKSFKVMEEMIQAQCVPPGKRLNYLWLMLAHWEANWLITKKYSRSLEFVNYKFHGEMVLQRSDLYGTLILTVNEKLEQTSQLTLLAIFMASKEGLDKVYLKSNRLIRFKDNMSHELLMRLIYRLLTIPGTFIDIFQKWADSELLRNEY